MDARVPGREVQGPQHARGRSGLDAATQRREQAVAAGGAGRLAPGHGDEEPVRAHGLQAHDVFRRQLTPGTQGGEHGRELAHGAVVGRPAQLGLLPAGPSEVDVDHVGRALRLEEAAHVLDHRGQRGQAGEPVVELALVAEPLRPQPVVIVVGGAAQRALHGLHGF